MTIKELVKKYQGKYYLGYEVGGEETYLFIKKVVTFQEPRELNFMTYSNVIFSRGDAIVFEQNREWYFGRDFIKRYKYKEIPKSLFTSVIKRSKLKKFVKDDKEYHVDFVSTE